MKVALYARVSTTNGQNPEMQLVELREYAAKRQWVIMGEFTDIGQSGSKQSRPQLDQMLKLARSRKIDCIACWKLDRFARSLKHLVNQLDELQALGVAFVSLRDNIDLSTPAGRLMCQLLGAMAEFERALIVERVRAGLAHARARGIKLERKTIDRGKDKDAKQIRALREAGLSFVKIGKQLNRSTDSVIRIFKSL